MMFVTTSTLLGAGKRLCRPLGSLAAFGLLLVLILSGGQASAATKPKLAQSYTDFLTGPPSLLLTKVEKDTFTHLTTDLDRDVFIERFWAVRNRTPGLGANDFKEEFYRRVAYANAYYGADRGTKQGWSTDRGRTYVLFGKPQTTANFHGNQEIYATELWFYSNPGLPELPSFFYILFFEGDGVSGYRAYRPYIDGPEKLMRERGYSNQQAYQYLRNINPELASSTLTFIPGEPPDLDTYTGSMASNVIVNAVQGYSEMPSYVKQIAERTALLTRVTSRIEYKLASVNLTAFVAEQDGESWLHWQIEVLDPAEKWTPGKASFAVSASLYTQGRLVLQKSDTPEFPLSAAVAEEMGKRPVVYADMIPVETGKYQLSVSMKNTQTGVIHEASREFEVHGAADTVAFSDILLIDRHEPESRRRPFQFGGAEFYPSPQGYVVPSRGLSILYQLQLPAKRPSELVVHYTVGQVTGSAAAKKTFDEKLDLRTLDAAGAILTSRTLPIEELGPGQYRLSVRVEDPASAKVAATAISFTVPSEITGKPPVVMAKGQADNDQSRAAVRYERALCLLATDRPAEAVAALRQSWELSGNAAVRSLLDHLSAISSRTAGQTGGTREIKN